ncbi:MAG: hypothetical protein GX604_07625 [Actinobacteria bacterium]|nr:hypothetical protein [Actinomycetota bacterium]
MALSDKDFLGLEVVGLDEAAIVGTVQGLIVDDAARAVVALIIDTGAYQSRVVPYAAVQSVGDDAVVISSAAEATLITEAPALEKQAQRDIQLSGCLVLTEAGQVLGVIDDFFIDAATGTITELEIEPAIGEGQETFRVPADILLQVGDEIVIVRVPASLPTPDSTTSSATSSLRTILDSDMIGLQIVARDEAAIVGQVDALIVDEQQLVLAGFLVNLGLYDPLVLPREKASVVGPDALLVDSAADISPLSANSPLEELASRRGMVAESRAVTISGRSVGRISHLYIDADDGSILGLQFVPTVVPAGRPNSLLLPLSCVVKIGKGLAVVTDDYASCLSTVPTTHQEHSAAPPSPPGVTLTVVETTPAAEMPTQIAEIPDTDAGPTEARESILPEESQPVLESTEAHTPAEGASQHFLLGKHLMRRLELPSGEVLAEAGDMVTAELIRQVKEHNLLLVLSLNVE